MNISFGIKTSQMGVSYPEILRIWREADQLPTIEHAWLWDHLIPIRGPVDADALEAWTLLSALAAQTARLRLGVLVTSNRLRSPTLLAKMAATVDVIAGGRLEFGIGAGGSRVEGNPGGTREFDAYGIPIVTPGRAVGDLAEALQVIDRMWRESEPFDFCGPTLRLQGAICAPRPVQRPRPPILVGGRGDRMLRIVARHADIWSYPGGPGDDYRGRAAALAIACEAIGRDPRTIAHSMQLIVRSDEPGAAAAARETIAAMAAAGVRHIVIAPLLEGRPVSWLVENITLPALAMIE